MSGSIAASASLTNGTGPGARTGGVALQPVLRKVQQSRGFMQPAAPEDQVQHNPCPCTRLEVLTTHLAARTQLSGIVYSTIQLLADTQEDQLRQYWQAFLTSQCPSICTRA